eukprot:c20680_g1_i2.p1 GENE.c20680_g1_i2~~c20680_g1_i2.p1  ORF type:complete len:519 (-),score=215.42 c20680_g1_i2:53-1609(-)
MIAELIEHPFSRDFWIISFGTQIKVSWQLFKDAFLMNSKGEMIPREGWDDDCTDLIAHQLDCWFRGEVHVCAFNYFTKKHGLFGAMFHSLNAHFNYVPKSLLNNSNNSMKIKGSNIPFGCDPLLEQTILLIGVDIRSCILYDSPNSQLPILCNSLHLWLTEMGEISRVIPAIHGIGVVIEFKTTFNLESLSSSTRPLSTQNLMIKGRHFIDVVYPSPYSVDTVIYKNSIQQQNRISFNSVRFLLLETTMFLEASFADEETFTAELSALQQWLESSLLSPVKNIPSASEISSSTPSSPFFSEISNPNPEQSSQREKDIIHTYKEHVTKTSQDYENRQNIRKEKQEELNSIIETKHFSPSLLKIHSFLNAIRNENVRILKGNLSSATKTTWITSLQGAVNKYVGESVTVDEGIKSFAEIVMADGRNFRRLLKKIKKQKSEKAKDVIIERELPGDYAITCAQADDLLHLLSSKNVKCDALIHLFPAITDKKNWNDLLEKHVPAGADRDSVQSFVANMSKVK